MIYGVAHKKRHNGRFSPSSSIILSRTTRVDNTLGVSVINLLLKSVSVTLL